MTVIKLINTHAEVMYTTSMYRSISYIQVYCSLVPRLSPSMCAIYVSISNSREGKEGEGLVVNRALPVRGQQLYADLYVHVYNSRVLLMRT